MFLESKSKSILKHYLLIIIVCSFLQQIDAQDIHWSQFDYNPVFQNPANVGQFNGGDYRFHANYRDQWRSVTVPFQTFSVSGEAKSILHDNLSLGAFIFNDVSGDGQFRTIEIQPSASWTFKITPDSSHLLRLGAQMGLNYRQFNADAYTFDNQWNGFVFDPGLPTEENFVTQRRTNFTFGIGASYEFYQSKKSRIIGGIGFFNINQPNQGFFGEEILRKRRFNFFTRAEYKIDLDWDILPSIQVNLQGTYREFIFGSQARYTMKDRLGEYLAVLFGAYIRGGDAAYILGGVEWQNWWGGISYDINFSKLNLASRSRGGIEFSLRYIFTNYKPSNRLFRVCPDYI